MDSNLLNKELNMDIITSLYLFIAEDDYIADSYIKLMKKKVAANEFAQLNENYFEAKKSVPSEVSSVCNTLPVMAEKRVVIVRDRNISKYTALCAELVKYAKNACPSTVLIVHTNDCDKRTSLYKTFNEIGKIVEFAKLKNDALSRWIKNSFTKRNLTIADDAVRYMIDASDYGQKDADIDIGYFANEIEKLALYDPSKKQITLEIVKKVFSVNINEDIFKLTDALIDGDASAAYKQIHKILYNKTVPQIVIAAIARTLRNLCISQSLYENGKSEAVIAKEYAIHPYVVKKSIGAAKKFSKTDGLKSLLVLSKLDIMLKTGLSDADTAMLLMVEDICARTFLLAGEQL